MAQINAGLADVARYRLQEQGGDPANPAAGYGYLYCKADGVYFKQDDGTVIGPFGAPWADIGARVYNSGNISIANASTVALTFDTERWDTDAIHSTIANTSRLTCKTAGKYIITGNIRWASHSTGTRLVGIRLGGATNLAQARDQASSAAAGNHGLIVTTIYDLAVNNYVELTVYQSSGGNLNVEASLNISPEFSMQRIG